MKVGDARSKPRMVNAGAPPGSVLGSYLFNIGIDDLEDDCPAPPEDHQTVKHLPRSDDFPVSSMPSRVRPSPDDLPVTPEISPGISTEFLSKGSKRSYMAAQGN